MLGLPKSTAISRPLSKEHLFERCKPDAAARRLFNEQISRVAIAGEISPQTVNIPFGDDGAMVYIMLVTLKTAVCSKRNIELLAKMINQRMLLILQYAGSARLAACHAGRIHISPNKPLEEWEITLKGLDLDSVWENIVAEVAGIELAAGENLAESLLAKEQREKLAMQITVMEKKARYERQPRRKWDLAEKIKQLKEQLKGEMEQNEKT